MVLLPKIDQRVLLQSVKPPADGPVMPFKSTGAGRDPSAKGGIDTEGVAKDAKSTAKGASDQAKSTAEGASQQAKSVADEASGKAKSAAKGASEKAQSAAKDAQSRVTK